MPKLIERNFCSGCTACCSICPKGAIRMVLDFEGFKYPLVDSSKCIECGLCEKVCPVLRNTSGTTGNLISDRVIKGENQYAVKKGFPLSHEPLAVYAVVSRNDAVRLESSSGGVFSLLAEGVLKAGGVVYGAGWEKGWHLVHRCAETSESLSELRGSKYLQSDLDGVFEKVAKQLLAGRVVLFSGCPCQTAGLDSYLRFRLEDSHREHLVLVDLICHAVPSPKVFARYLEELEETYRASVTKIVFRQKDFGWKRHSIFFGFENGQTHHVVSVRDPYMRAFYGELCNRPSCHRCSFRSGRGCSDITLADYWSVHERFPGIDDDKGVSLVLLNTRRGVILFDALAKEAEPILCPSDMQDVRRVNPSIWRSEPQSRARRMFFERYLGARVPLEKLTDRMLRKSFFLSFAGFLKRQIGVGLKWFRAGRKD